VFLGLGLACQEGLFTGWRYSSVARLHLCTASGGGGQLLIEHDGLWVLVHHLGHVAQDVLLGDDAQETPEHKGNKVRGRKDLSGYDALALNVFFISYFLTFPFTSISTPI